MAIKKITILGATGSIGRSTLDLLERHADKFSVYALTANKNVTLLLEQCLKFKPEHVVIADKESGKAFSIEAKRLNVTCEVHIGHQALIDVAGSDEADILMAAIVGTAGLLPTMAALSLGKTILLANKESLVMAGALFMDKAKQYGTTILPVDSEHNAIFQSLPDNSQHRSLQDMGVKKLILTASGGPFLKRPLETLKDVTIEEACAHPNWDMGKKISVDSATMMNKGFEIIEAHWLFSANYKQIDVVIQPQSIIHSMVEYIDGSVIAELGEPDMRTPIAHVLGLPKRLKSGVKSLDFNRLSQLEFLPLDFSRFPMMKLAYSAIQQGGSASLILNATNEIAVASFLDSKIQFLQIKEVAEQILNNETVSDIHSIEDAIECNTRIKEATVNLIKTL
jgi:1-deoxy-D-xylulose-5-phosphate reductoisomerase